MKLGEAGSLPLYFCQGISLSAFGLLLQRGQDLVGYLPVL
jgi:hypothetical protein